MNWSIVDFSNADGNPIVTPELRDAPYSHSMWDFSFQALYMVRLNPKSLSTELTIKNTDSKPFSFNTALHTYFSGSVTGASIKSLKGCKTLNKDPDPKIPVESIEDRDVITFPGFVDCVYLNAPSQIELNNGLGETITLKNTNWSDCVLWNPHLTMEHCYKDFVCVENAKLAFYTLNSSRSAYQAITFNPHFFDVYTILAVQVRCSILLKTIVVEFWWFVELRFGFTPIFAKKDQASLWFQKDCTNRVQSYDWASCSWRQLRNPCSRLEMHTYSCFSYIIAAYLQDFFTLKFCSKRIQLVLILP